MLYKVFYVCLTLTIALMIGGFFAPPLGIVDNSILICVGFLFGFATLALLPYILGSVKHITTKIGDNVLLDIDSKGK